jgi:lipoate-protein ligase A
LQRLNELEWDWVRRPTGGRAILHTDELTYSVIAPLNEPRVFGSVLESYRRLSGALMTALQLLGISAESQPSAMPDSGRSKAAICFEVPSNYEIVVQGKKLIGSAQARRKEGILQHGTLPLWGDLTRITQALMFPDGTKRIDANIRLLARATTVETILGYKISWDTAAQAFVAGFQSELGLELIQSELSPPEKKRTSDLVREKYTHPSWLSRI